SATGAKADHRLPVRASEILNLAQWIEVEAAARIQGGSLLAGLMGPEPQGDAAKFAKALAADLAASRGPCIVIPGDHHTPQVHLLAHRLNQTLGNVGKTVFYTDPINANPINQTESLKELAGDMRAGKVDLLFILGGNPAYDSPADLGFADL